MPELVGGDILLLLQRMGGSPDRIRIAALWKAWPKVLGEEFAWIIPLGHKESTLFVGVQNAIEIQELTLQSPQILDLVNEFMEREYFTTLRISLAELGKWK